MVEDAGEPHTIVACAVACGRLVGYTSGLSFLLWALDAPGSSAFPFFVLCVGDVSFVMVCFESSKLAGVAISRSQRR